MDRVGIGAIPCWSMDTRKPRRKGQKYLLPRPRGDVVAHIVAI
jgi:hypothetical protein